MLDVLYYNHVHVITDILIIVIQEDKIVKFHIFLRLWRQKWSKRKPDKRHFVGYHHSAEIINKMVFLKIYHSFLGYVHTAPFLFLSVLMIKRLPVHIAPLSNDCARDTIGVNTVPANGVVDPFSKQSLR